MKNIKCSNLNDEILDKNKGKDCWFIGNKEPIKPEFFSNSVGVKWTMLSKGQKRPHSENGTPKNIITILIKGKHQITVWPFSDAEPEEYLLEKEGDYVFIKRGMRHTWETFGEDNLILTVCW